MKTCLIYGQNGLDLCVTFNLVAFYKKLGFLTFFSVKLYDADLLVVLRAVDNSIDLSKFNFSVIHVYDYVGNDYDAFVNSIDKNITYIFTTSEEKRIRIIKKLTFPKEQIFLALAPIEIKLWQKEDSNLKYNLTHVGNYKPITDDDPVKKRFIDAIKGVDIDVWGFGWNPQLMKGSHNGRAGIFEVSSIYAKTKVALGFMYPFQRDVTYSSRFWQTTLNGCYMLSEPGLYTSIIPGIIETDYSIEDIKRKTEQIGDRQALKVEAERFWTDQNEKTLSYVLPTLKLIKDVDFSSQLKRYVIYKRLSVINILQKWYQKLQFFKIIDVRSFIKNHTSLSK